MADRIQLRGDTAANWTSANPVLAQREIGLELSTNNLKIGDGSTAWNDLPYAIIAEPTIAVSVRNTVLTGPSSWLAAGTGLQVVSSGAAKATIAEGFDTVNGEVNQVFNIPDGTAWNSLPASSTPYLYVTFDGITLATGNSTLAPFYGPNAPSSPTTGQWWFNTTTYEGQSWNGSAWVDAPRLYVGQCTTDGSGVTGVVTYAYQGRYTAPITLPSAAGNTNINHLLGVNFTQQILPHKFFAVCTTAAHGYSIGDEGEFYSRGDSTRGFNYRSDEASLINSILTSSVGVVQIVPKTGGNAVIPTLASFDITVSISRAF